MPSIATSMNGNETNYSLYRQLIYLDADKGIDIN